MCNRHSSNLKSWWNRLWTVNFKPHSESIHYQSYAAGCHRLSAVLTTITSPAPSLPNTSHNLGLKMNGDLIKGCFRKSLNLKKKGHSLLVRGFQLFYLLRLLSLQRSWLGQVAPGWPLSKQPIHLFYCWNKATKSMKIQTKIRMNQIFCPTGCRSTSSVCVLSHLRRTRSRSNRGKWKTYQIHLFWPSYLPRSNNFMVAKWKVCLCTILGRVLCSYIWEKWQKIGTQLLAWLVCSFCSPLKRKPFFLGSTLLICRSRSVDFKFVVDLDLGPPCLCPCYPDLDKPSKDVSERQAKWEQTSRIASQIFCQRRKSAFVWVMSQLCLQEENVFSFQFAAVVVWKKNFAANFQFHFAGHLGWRRQQDYDLWRGGGGQKMG